QEICPCFEHNYSITVIMLKAWTYFLQTLKENIGDKFFAVDQAIMHTTHSQVKELMQVEPQIRGNDLGIIRILAPSYLLNNPLSLGMNGNEHQGVREIFLYALPDPFTEVELLSQLVDQCLEKAVIQRQLHIGEDLPKMILDILHQSILQISLTPEEIEASRTYNKTLPLASLPNLVNKYILSFRTGASVKHRRSLIAKYKQSPRFSDFLEIGNKYQLNADTIANSIFDMIHIAGTAGTSALLGSVIGVLLLNDSLKDQVVSEINNIWNQPKEPDTSALENSQILNQVILETARLYPPVRFVSQLAKDSGEIQIGATKCPFQQGTRLLSISD
ncbi:MAG: cytochrome P450, partial [Sphaerospermopsis sp. SIO1G2]|nr:cytochrome P450 [Sphaerospermopsis sp. SIO1G2]